MGACFAHPTGCPSIAVPLGVAHPPWGDYKSTQTEFNELPPTLPTTYQLNALSNQWVNRSLVNG